MQIGIKKKTEYLCEYTITRNNRSQELITLETKTYFVHDICHYVVEKNLEYSEGFWGMLFQGCTFKELFGRDNSQTMQLRFIEQIVGPVQSVHWGHMSKQHFEQSIEHLNIKLTESFLNSCLTEIDAIVENWRQLKVGQQLALPWTL